MAVSSGDPTNPTLLRRRETVKDQAQVVIIGGGIFGTSIAYHLARAG
jgi:glycerol-3-phosphate dehydrogenase